MRSLRPALGLIAASSRGTMRCRRAAWRRRTYRGLARRRGRSRLRFACAGGQHHSKHRKHRSKNDRFFHSVNCFFTNNSSQVASPDVLKEKNSRFCRMCPFVHYMSILLRCRFSSPRFRFDSKILFLSARGRGDFRRRAFSLAAILCARRLASACSTASSNRSRASLRFWACERESCTVTLTPLGR
jgi:hypothetical protein